jgi:hypothetical protein
MTEFDTTTILSAARDEALGDANSGLSEFAKHKR